MTARLPVVGGDDNVWGTVLNSFLSVAHNPAGNVVTPGLLPSGGDDTAAINAANAAGQPLGAGTFSVGGVITAPRGQGPDRTILQASAAGARVQHGPALGTLPTVDNETYGGFTFNGNNVATGALVTINTSGTYLEPVVVENGLGDGAIIAGQNQHWEYLQAANLVGAGVAWDNGCGFNTISKLQVSRCQGWMAELRESVAPPAGAYNVPEFNVVEECQLELGTGSSLGCIHQLAGAWNEFRNAILYCPLGVSLVKLEPNTAPGRSGDANGRLYLTGKSSLTGSVVNGTVGIETNAVSGGVAGTLNTDLAVITDELVLATLSVGIKSGATNAIVSRRWYDLFTVTTLFQTNGTGAASFLESQGLSLEHFETLVSWRGGQAPQGSVAGTYALPAFSTTGAILAPGSNFSPNAIVYLDPAEHLGFGTLYYRVKAIVATNATAPAITFTVGLYPVTASGGGSNTNTMTFGTVVSGSTVAFTTPSASTLNQGTSGEFVAPSAGFYALGVVLSGTSATSSATQISAMVQRIMQ